LIRDELPAAVASAVRSASLARLSPAPDREADGLEKPHVIAQASAEDQIAALRRQLDEQQGVNASFEERLGRLETARTADATADVVVSFPPDAREATVDQPPADADANPDATGDKDGYAVFGHVVEGMDNVVKVLNAPTSATAGEGAMKGQMIEVPIVITTARRLP
jgi:cyclophilin family peptidyl-prolyl cis-trans isomerase